MSARFEIPTNQLQRTVGIPLFFALAVRIEDEWVDFLIISREDLIGYEVVDLDTKKLLVVQPPVISGQP